MLEICLKSVSFLKCKLDHVPIQNSPKIPFTFRTKSKFLFFKLYKVLHNPAPTYHWISSLTTFYLLYSLCSNLCPNQGGPPQGRSIFCSPWNALSPDFFMAIFLTSLRSLLRCHFKIFSKILPALHSLSTYPTSIFFITPKFTDIHFLICLEFVSPIRIKAVGGEGAMPVLFTTDCIPNI